MAIYIKTNDPVDLKKKIDFAINHRDIVTWSVDSDGDYTIDRDQWRYKCWLRPIIDDNMLKFGIVSSRKYLLTNELYGFKIFFTSTPVSVSISSLKDINGLYRLMYARPIAPLKRII